MTKIDWKGVALLVLLAVLIAICATSFVATAEKERRERAEYRAAFIGECIREGQRPYICEYMYQSMMNGRR